MSQPLITLANLGIKLEGLTTDSRLVKSGTLFLAYPGERADGRQFIAQAIERGTAAVLWEQADFAWDSSWQVPNLAIKNLRESAGYIAGEFFKQPSQSLWMLGVTGTNGKTSCSHWLAQAFAQLGRKTAVVGTLGNGFPDALTEAVNTTPDPVLLQGMLADYLQQGATTVAMEVSSHGLEQGRVNGVHFDVAVFTNLSRDHLDYHGDMAAYGAAKKQLFDWNSLKCAVLNVDDAFGAEIAESLKQQGRRVLTYGLEHGDVHGSHLQLSEHGLTMQVDTPFGNATLQAALLGRFNAYNLLAVLAALLASDISLADAISVLKTLKSVAGRMQQLGGDQQPLVVIDYAHTPDALEKVLMTLREQVAGKLICVFGSGGNRDKGKRPLMGEVVRKWADVAIVTSDNPRNEVPEAIISDITAGMHGEYQIQKDRTRAIAQAIGMAGAGDVVLIAGKGHEPYQEIAGVKHPYSDMSVAQAELAKRMTA
jgi:UDP-N-acetylmuramoyl-L-alanyl-D-glutamate--2,6-diaminopimelate ligase